MDKKHAKLPKEGLVEPENRRMNQFIDDTDVEGHGLPLTPPPGVVTRGPSHGGENIPTIEDEDDVEGHRA